MKIDRTEPRELLVYDDKTDYTTDEIHGILNIEIGNRSKYGQRANSLTGCSKIISAFGIVGKFLTKNPHKIFEVILISVIFRVYSIP